MLMHEKDLDTPEKYWDKIGQGTDWATVVEVLVAAMIYNINIIVYPQHSIQVNSNSLECQNNASCTLQKTLLYPFCLSFPGSDEEKINGNEYITVGTKYNNSGRPRKEIKDSKQHNR
jgi:hypothetical protein